MASQIWRLEKAGRVIESERQRKMRGVGSTLVIIGLLLAIFGFYKLNTTAVMCPANGCDSATLWLIYGPYEVSFYGGQLLMAIGALTVLLSKFIKVTNNVQRIEMGKIASPISSLNRLISPPQAFLHFLGTGDTCRFSSHHGLVMTDHGPNFWDEPFT